MKQKQPVLITGIGQRLGLYLAQCFLARGVPVIGTYRTERGSINQLRNLGAELYRCDFTIAQELDRFTELLLDRHHGLRAIIHNASDWGAEDKTPEKSELFSRMMAIHVAAPYQINHQLTPLLEACNDDCSDIVHISDFVSSKGSKNHIAYAASKAAQDNLTLSFSARLAPKIKVNSIAPALLMFAEHDDEVYREKAKSKGVMRKAGGADELLKAVDYLMDSHYITGRVIHLDGGRNVA